MQGESANEWAEEKKSKQWTEIKKKENTVIIMMNVHILLLVGTCTYCILLFFFSLLLTILRYFSFDILYYFVVITPIMIRMHDCYLHLLIDWKSGNFHSDECYQSMLFAFVFVFLLWFLLPLLNICVHA